MLIFLVVPCILCPSFILFFCAFLHICTFAFLCSAVKCNSWPALMDERLFLAACHDYVLCVYLLLFVWQNKISSSSSTTDYWQLDRLHGLNRPYHHHHHHHHHFICSIKSTTVKEIYSKSKFLLLLLCQFLCFGHVRFID